MKKLRGSTIAIIPVLVVIVVFKIKVGHRMELWNIIDEIGGVR